MLVHGRFALHNKKTSRALYDSSLTGWDKKYINGRNLNPLIKSIPEYDVVIGIADHNKHPSAFAVALSSHANLQFARINISTL